MNRERRDAISEIIDDLDALREKICDIRDEEQEAYDNLPEGIQCSDRGDSMCENVDDLDDVYSDFDDIIKKLEDIIDR